MSILKTEQLSHLYSVGTPFEKAAIEDVNLEINQGEFVGVIGHTGSGKSTLIQHFNGLLKPTSGKIYLDGEDIWADKSRIRAVRFAVGLVFQYPEYQLFEETVYKDIAFGPKNMGLGEDEIDQRVKEAAALVGLRPELLEKSPFELSGGQKRRAAIAGVIAMEPKCIVLDEPTAMLDPNGRREVIRAVEKLRKEKQVTVILITHYMEEVIDADQVFVMDGGHIVMHGTPREIFSRVEELKNYRMDVPQVTMLAEELRKRGLDIPRGILRREELVEALCRLR